MSDREKVIELARKGKTRKQIAAELDMQYYMVQHYLRGVKNVKREPDRGGVPDGTGSPIIIFNGERKPRSEVVRIMLDQGYGVAEISRELKTPYRTVYAVAQRHGKVNTSRQKVFTIDGKQMSTKKAVQTLTLQGWSAREIQDEYGISGYEISLYRGNVEKSRQKTETSDSARD